MIIARSPLRITLGGGGTDLPSYYRKRGGFLLAGAINKHVYVSVHRTFIDAIVVRYSKIEVVQSRDEIQHPIVREAMKLVGIDERRIEITTMADVPAGTGLGSSGSFGTALMRALYRFRRETPDVRAVAEAACRVEIDILGEPTGKQDQYASAFGGVNAYDIARDGTVTISPLAMSEETLRRFGVGTLMFSTGVTRAAPTLLREQDDRTKADDEAMLKNLDDIKEIGYESKRVLEAGDLVSYGRLLDDHWQRKRRRSGGISNVDIDTWYAAGRDAGALGGKLIGAGGGGFLMFYTEEPAALRRAMSALGLSELRWSFDYEGCRLVL